MTTKKLPLFLENTFESLYGNFGYRLGALCLEGLLTIPITFGILFGNSQSLTNYYYTFALSQLVYLVYFIYLPVRYGATPGKRLLGMTILKIDGSAIGYRESFLKMLPMLIFALIGFLVQCYQVSLADADTFSDLRWQQQANYLRSLAPLPFYLYIALVYVFYFANLIIFLTNDRKRSIGDCLAGTVVVYDKFLGKIEEWGKEN